MSNPELHVERLDAGHNVSGFASGADELDIWLRRHALAAEQMDSARTFVLLTRQDQVVGYFSLTMGSILRQDAPPRLVRGLPGYPVGMALLARLAVDKAQQATGMAGCSWSKHSAEP